MNRLLLFTFSMWAFTISYSQVINGYAKVTNITGSTLTLSNVNEAADTFEDDEWVILMQMQDDVIGTTGNVLGFGDLDAINSAGIYEIRQIDSHVEASGTPTSVTLKTVPNFTYNTGTNSSVQIISFPSFGSPDYTTTANINALGWNGNVGGVVAMFVPGTLTLAHNISADTTGFRGGDRNAGGAAGCTPTGNYSIVTQDNHADKGEGIYKATDPSFAAGREKILNGGGGGNSHNAGGGGGGNFTAGGLGGPGWNNCSPSAGGFGGIDLSADISVSRIFMGGGGGAGEGNNNLATDGANGGGIILIRATEIETTTCTGATISANGESILLAPGNDGGGGGGAGGSIVFEVASWNISAACPLTVSANGGDGGSVGNSGTHGGGGGGGQGVVFYSVTEPTTNVTTETNNGDGGCNNNSSPCNSQAGSGLGSDGAGIIDVVTGPLPIALVGFNAELIENNRVYLTWSTKSETNNDYFTIERSSDGTNWRELTTIQGAGNSTSTIDYAAWDFSPYPSTSYYRLKQTDFDGKTTIEKIASVYRSPENLFIYPNPSRDLINIEQKGIQLENIRIYDALGNLISIEKSEQLENLVRIDISSLTPGVYLVQSQINDKTENLKFVKTN